MTSPKFRLMALCAITSLFCSCATNTDPQGALAPGQYEWHPERSKQGPLLMVVSIDDQMAYVYRNGVQIARSTVSTGRAGKETPTGVFTILQRKVRHESNIYKGAQMPYMQRLTWGGIAMHAGNLPGYPASAGCVRLPLEFSEKLYGLMRHGSTVVITKKRSTPSKSSRPANILLASRAANPQNRAIPDPEGRVVWQPGKSPSGPLSILISYTDQTLYLWRNGVQIGQSPMTLAPGARPAEGVFMVLEGREPNNPRFPGLTMHPWSVLSLDGRLSSDPVETMRSSIVLPTQFRKKLNRILTPGTILVTTRQSSNASSRSDRDFTIMKTE